MGPPPRPEHHLNLNYLPQLSNKSRSGSSTASTSPIEPPSGGSLRFPIGSGSSLASVPAPTNRLGAGSPSHEFSGRLFPKRAREIQAQEGVSPQPWGPPTSGNSTPLRETIPESPNGESFPDFNLPVGIETTPIGTVPQSTKRGRAGTLPSRIPSASSLTSGLLSQSSLLPRTSRPTPSTSPFQLSSGPPEPLGFAATPNAVKLAQMSRLRAESMPQRGLGNPIGSPWSPSPFSQWGGGQSRLRGSTLASIRSSDGPASPSQSSFSRDSLADTDVRTLDYLGLVDTPQQSRATLAPSDIEMLLESQRHHMGLGSIGDLKNANRFRSYSVNAKEKYADEEDLGAYTPSYASGVNTPDASSAAAFAIHEAVRQHNLEVQAFANFASQNRPRARTAGVLDSPSSRLMRSYMPTPSRLDASMTAADLDISESAEYASLAEAVQGLQLNMKPIGDGTGDELSAESPTRALWLGNIPSSTTVSSLNVIFGHFGTIESARVLTHKNCGFVNFETLESAVRAKSQLHGKEIFPGAGPIRIGYAKAPSTSGTPGKNGLYPSPSPDPLAKGDSHADAHGRQSPGGEAPGAPTTPALVDIRGDIVRIVKDLGANDEEQLRIAALVDRAIQSDHYITEIPPIPEPSHSRVHDAPRLREIRKRIGNNSCSQAEVEDIAINMLPEIAELASDYLGNTVVQRLFEFCSDGVKEAMLREIAPHLAEIGVHKNGTWAAQKIIDVARTTSLMSMIVESLRTYSVPLFLDQFGNYVMQGCLRYQTPLNDFIFEAMVSRLWELAQGRYGARAMRACLESHHATKDQQRMVAAAIALHSVQLATNANGALLLTWFLDTCTFPRRRTVLAPRLVPHLVHLCTHKVAYLTVLKLINQRNEPEARDTILQALFFSPNDAVLEDILSDQACGATLIFKVLTTPFFDEKIRAGVIANVRSVLLRIKAQPQQGYKRLMDEVGLSTRGGGPARDVPAREPIDHARPGSQHGGHPQDARAMYAQGPGAYPLALERTGSMESNQFEATFPLTVNTMNGPTLYSNASPMPLAAMTPQSGMPYPMMPAMTNGPRPGGYYPPLDLNGYPTPGTPMNVGQFRGGPAVVGGAPPGMGMGGSPMTGFPPAYAGNMMGAPYGGYPMQYLPSQQAQQAGGTRRGRR